MRSQQTLSEPDRRLVAHWEADCAEGVLELFEEECPTDTRPRALIERARAFAGGKLAAGDAIRQRFVGGVCTNEAMSEAARAAVCHMGAHGLGAAAYAAVAVGLAAFDVPEAAGNEIRWHVSHMSEAVQCALSTLPPVGVDSSGPLGPGLLSRGKLLENVRELQLSLAQSNSPGNERSGLGFAGEGWFLGSQQLLADPECADSALA